MTLSNLNLRYITKPRELDRHKKNPSYGRESKIGIQKREIGREETSLSWRTLERFWALVRAWTAAFWLRMKASLLLLLLKSPMVLRRWESVVWCEGIKNQIRETNACNIRRRSDPTSAPPRWMKDRTVPGSYYFLTASALGYLYPLPAMVGFLIGILDILINT